MGLLRSLVVGLVALTALLAAGSATAEGIAVIVHPERSDRLDAAEIVQVYLKQRRFWKDGTRIVAVNREAGSAIRAEFVSRVLQTSPSRLAVYWNRQYFQGVLPPATLASGEAVRRFVATERAAIGYVDPAVADDSVRVLFEISATH